MFRSPRNHSTLYNLDFEILPNSNNNNKNKKEIDLFGIN